MFRCLNDDTRRQKYERETTTLRRVLLLVHIWPPRRWISQQHIILSRAKTRKHLCETFEIFGLDHIADHRIDDFDMFPIGIPHQVLLPV
jgi:hypothetical protein